MEFNMPSEEQIRILWGKYEVPNQVIDHCKVVSQRALEILNDRDVLLSKSDSDIIKECIRSAALLHDIARTQKNHEEVGAYILEQEGYPELAWIVARHSYFPQDDWTHPLALETAVLYIADKQVSGTKYVTIDERFARSRRRLEQYENAEKALVYHEEKFRQIKEIIKYFNLEKSCKNYHCHF